MENLRLSTTGPRYDHGSAALLIPVVARISGAVDQLYIAEGAAETVLSTKIATPFLSGLAGLGLALIAVHREDVDMAREQYVSLSIAVRAKIFLNIVGDRVLGLLARTMGDLDQATAHFEDALAFCRMARFQPEHAWACYDYADTLLHSPKSLGRTVGDRSNVNSLLDEALAISGELGMRPLTERVRVLQELATRQLGPEPAYPDGLTKREVEVLRLIATGLSNREIGTELVLSTRTVERHITNIYGKISARGRADATAYALGHQVLRDNPNL